MLLKFSPMLSQHCFPGRSTAPASVLCSTSPPVAEITECLQVPGHLRLAEGPSPFISPHFSGAHIFILPGLTFDVLSGLVPSIGMVLIVCAIAWEYFTSSG